MSNLRGIPTVLLICIVCGGGSGLDMTATEVEITFSLLKHFHGSHCIYILDDPTQKFWPERDFGEQDNYFLSVSTFSHLQDFMVNTLTGEKRSGRSVIVLRAEEDSLSRLRQISQTMNLSLLVWIIYSEKPLDKTDFQGIYIPFNCEFVYINARDNLYLMTEMYQIENNSDIHTCNFGYWTKDGGLFVHEELFYRRRKSLEGHRFPTLIGNAPPYVMGDESSGNEQFTGYMYEVWKELQYRVRFEMELSQQVHDRRSKGLNIDRVEFAVLPIAYDHSTLDRMDITHPIYESRSYLFGHRPGSELEWDSYLKPFDANTWWVTLAWMACSAATLAIFYRIAWTFGTSEKEDEYFIFTYSESFATVFRAMCMQGSDVTPRSSACRLLFLSIYLTAFVVSSAFSAALFSLLTIPTPRAPFNEIQEVLDNRDYKMGLVPESEIHGTILNYTSKFPESIQSKLLDKVGRNERAPGTLLEGLNTVCRNRMYVMMSDLPYVLYTMQNMTLDCQEKVMPAGPLLLRNFIGFGLKKGSPYKELIDLHLLMMRNEGIMQRLLLSNWPPQIPSVQATWVRVTLADISPILYMFGLGVLLAIAILIAEKAQFLMCRSRKSEESKTSQKNRASLSQVFRQLPTSQMGDDSDVKGHHKLPSEYVRHFWR